MRLRGHKMPQLRWMNSDHDGQNTQNLFGRLPTDRYGAAQPSGWAELSEHLASLKNQKTMQPHTKHPAAVALGRMARGVPKRITESDRKRRQEWARGLAARRKKPKPD